MPDYLIPAGTLTAGSTIRIKIRCAITAATPLPGLIASPGTTPYTYIRPYRRGWLVAHRETPGYCPWYYERRWKWVQRRIRALKRMEVPHA